MTKKKQNHLLLKLQGYFFAGALTIIPIWVTWVIVEFLLRFISSAGKPLVNQMSDAIRPLWPSLAILIGETWFQSVFSVIIVVLLMIFLGWFANRLIGRRFIARVEALLERIPMVRSIYSSMKKLIIALQQKPDTVQRVVLIDFPSPEMKTVGLVTRTLTDKDTGRKLAAVYVPTTPNPTSGYLEIVPVEKIVSTNWTFDEAITFIVSGGAVGPKNMNYEKSCCTEEEFESGIASAQIEDE